MDLFGGRGGLPTMWKPGDPTFALLVVDLNRGIDQSHSVMTTLCDRQAFDRIANLEPNVLSYLSGHQTLFSVWTHADDPRRKRVLFLHNLSPSRFHTLLEEHLPGEMGFEATNDPHRVTYRRHGAPLKHRF